MNGRLSSPRPTKHIQHRYFLVKVLIDRGELEVKYMPTNQMWYDVLTKPLMGRKWQEMQSKLMNCPVNYDNEAERLATHLGLLPLSDTIGPPQGTHDCVQKPGVTTVRKTVVAKPDEWSLVKRVTTSPEKTISWWSPLIQYRSVLREENSGGSLTKPTLPKEIKKISATASWRMRASSGKSLYVNQVIKHIGAAKTYADGTTLC